MELVKSIFDPKTWRKLFSINKIGIGRWQLTITYLQHKPVTAHQPENYYIMRISLTNIGRNIIVRFFSFKLVYNSSIVTDTYGIFRQLLRDCKLERYISMELKITDLPNGHTLYTRILNFACKRWPCVAVNVFNGLVWCLMRNCGNLKQNRIKVTGYMWII